MDTQTDFDALAWCWQAGRGHIGYSSDTAPFPSHQLGHGVEAAAVFHDAACCSLPLNWFSAATPFHSHREWDCHWERIPLWLRLQERQNKLFLTFNTTCVYIVQHTIGGLLYLFSPTHLHCCLEDTCDVINGFYNLVSLSLSMWYNFSGVSSFLLSKKESHDSSGSFKKITFDGLHLSPYFYTILFWVQLKLSSAVVNWGEYIFHWLAPYLLAANPSAKLPMATSLYR